MSIFRPIHATLSALFLSTQLIHASEELNIGELKISSTAEESAPPSLISQENLTKIRALNIPAILEMRPEDQAIAYSILGHKASHESSGEEKVQTTKALFTLGGGIDPATEENIFSTSFDFADESTLSTQYKAHLTKAMYSVATDSDLPFKDRVMAIKILLSIKRTNFATETLNRVLRYTLSKLIQDGNTEREKRMAMSGIGIRGSLTIITASGSFRVEDQETNEKCLQYSWSTLSTLGNLLEGSSFRNMEASLPSEIDALLTEKTDARKPLTAKQQAILAKIKRK